MPYTNTIFKSKYNHYYNIHYIFAFLLTVHFVQYLQYINYIESYISIVIVYISVFYSVFFLFNNIFYLSSYKFSFSLKIKPLYPRTEVVSNSVEEFTLI